MARRDSIDMATAPSQAMEIERFAEAQDGSAQEHDLTLIQGLKLYPKAVFWSVVMSTAVIMEGYDTKLIGTLIAQPVFQKTYGQPAGGGTYQISAPWQTGLSDGSAGGQLLGLLLGGYLSERFGFRKTTIGGLVVIIGLIFMTFFAPNIVVLEVGQSLFGKSSSPDLQYIYTNMP